MNFMPREVYMTIMGSRKGETVHWRDYSIYNCGAPLKIFIAERGTIHLYMDKYGNINCDKNGDRYKMGV